MVKKMALESGQKKLKFAVVSKSWLLSKYAKDPKFHDYIVIEKPSGQAVVLTNAPNTFNLHPKSNLVDPTLEPTKMNDKSLIF